MAEPEQIPPPPPTIPASPLARDVEAAVERVFSRVVERVDASNAEVKAALRHMLDELFEMKREIEHLKIRVSAHDTQIAALVVASVKEATRKKKKGKRRRAARST